ncbi:MAG: aldo/keto reductase [candidate division Zixibacteria bacterium]|nr:aldo/keto reductase [candidate division Zixibacteria bacterium]
MLELRPVGRSGLSISPIGLGTVTFGREIDQDASFHILDHAVEKGITWIDTAEAYGGGNARAYRRNVLGVDDEREITGEMGSSELIIGRWLRACDYRDRLTICTKVSSGNSPENIRRALQVSLDRLQVDRVDIYKLHSPDTGVPIAETMGALAEQVAAGRIRTIGYSNFSLDQLREAQEAARVHCYPRMEIVQPPFSLATADIRRDILPYCREEQIAVTPFSPLAAGFLSGKYTSDRNAFPERSRFHVIPAHADIYFNDRNFQTVEHLREKARALDIPMVRLAMAWVATHPDVTSVIVGARTTAHIDNAFDALEINLEPALRAEMTAWTGV